MAAGDPSRLWDMFSSAALFPQRSKQGRSTVPSAKDGVYSSFDGTKIGYRAFKHPDGADGRPVIVLWHGNGELASHYDRNSRLFFEAGVSLVVVDFRGYGWSEGDSLLSKIGPDAAAFLPKMDEALESAGIPKTCPRILFGRSMGSVAVCAAASACNESEHNVKGIVLESSIAQIGQMPMAKHLARIMEGGPELLQSGALGDPFQNLDKLRSCKLPLLVIHGEKDDIAPLDQGQQLYDASGATDKTIVVIKSAGHNDITAVGGDKYWTPLREFAAKFTD